jgi:hypothetical protein
MSRFALKQAGSLKVWLAAFLPSACAMAPELVLGRWLAFCAHPVAAWRLLPLSGRCLIALSYAAAGYAAAFLGLVLIS